MRLEGRWDAPERPLRCVVFCHPHPEQRGTMTAPLMSAVTEHLVAAGFAVLRFNFRGVGESQGSHGGGADELLDVDAAVAAARQTYRALPLRIAGWSFGAAVALAWEGARSEEIPYAGIAPPVASPVSPPLPDTGDLEPAPRCFVIGDRDQFTEVDDLRRYADSIGARVEVIEGSDHFFYFREDRVADIVAAALE